MKKRQQWDATDIEVKRTHKAFTTWRKKTGGGPGHPIPSELWAEAVKLCECYSPSDVSRYLRIDGGRLRMRCRDSNLLTSSATLRTSSSDSFIELSQTGVADVLQGKLNIPSQVELQGVDGSLMRLQMGKLAAPELEALCRSFWINSTGGAQGCCK